nr:growth arrest-specific protein 1-like [Hydra vulgaris]
MFSQCRKTLNDIATECKNLLQDINSDFKCSQKCQLLLKNFISELSFGKDLSTCNCVQDANCLIYKRRFQICLDNKTDTAENGCQKYHKQCDNSETCKMLYTRWFDSCTDLFNEYEYTAECKVAEKNLFANDIGGLIKSCDCDGDTEQEKFCLEVRRDIEKFCGIKLLYK